MNTNYIWFQHSKLPINYLILEGQQFYKLRDIVIMLQQSGVSKINTQMLSRWISDMDIIYVCLDDKNSRPKKLVNNRALLRIFMDNKVMNQRLMVQSFTAKFNSFSQPKVILPLNSLELPMPVDVHIKNQVDHEIKSIKKARENLADNLSNGTLNFRINDLLQSLSVDPIQLKASHLNKKKIDSNIRVLRLKWKGSNFIPHVKQKDKNNTVSSAPVPIFPMNELVFFKKFLSELLKLGLKRSNYKIIKRGIPSLISKLIAEDQN